MPIAKAGRSRRKTLHLLFIMLLNYLDNGAVRDQLLRTLDVIYIRVDQVVLKTYLIIHSTVNQQSINNQSINLPTHLPIHPSFFRYLKHPKSSNQHLTPSSSRLLPSQTLQDAFLSRLSFPLRRFSQRGCASSSSPSP